MTRCVIILGRFRRWIIVKADEPGLAWTGSRWVTHDRGIPTDNVQVCNFDTESQAETFAVGAGLEVKGD